MTPLKAIRAHCVSCKGRKKAAQCDAVSCELHPFRTGKNPNHAAPPRTEEQRVAAVARLAKAREVRAAIRAANREDAQ